jgi:hypothetical protein
LAQGKVGAAASKTDRATVAAVFDPLECPTERREPVPQAGGHGVVDALLLVAAPDKSHRVWPHDHLSGGIADFGQQLLHLPTLRA